MHFTEAFDRLREHRNRIIHRLKFVVEVPGRPPTAVFYGVDRQGVSHDHLTDGEIAALVNICWAFEDYARRVMVATEDDGTMKAGESLPERPELPTRYVETRHPVR